LAWSGHGSGVIGAAGGEHMAGIGFTRGCGA
jgi:hypothetical protein